MEGFKYVINAPPTPKIAFGTTLDRVTLPLSGPCLSPFMRAQQGEADRSPGPAARVDGRNYLMKPLASRYGYSAFANKSARLPAQKASQYPSVGAYTIDVCICKRKRGTYKPFGIGALRDKTETFLTPPPGSYVYNKPKPQLQVSTAFGTQRKFKPHVITKCTPTNVAKCIKCSKTPQGDYWHNVRTNADMCRSCMNLQMAKLHSCKISGISRLRLRHELERYRKMRYCEFYHDHKGTTAATQIITDKTLKFKINKENYLSLFIK